MMPRRYASPHYSGYGHFTTKEGTKSTKFKNENVQSFVTFVLLYLKVFAAYANLWRPSLLKTRICSRQDAKNAKFGSKIFLCGLCVLARDILTFGCGIAALGSRGASG